MRQLFAVLLADVGKIILVGDHREHQPEQVGDDQNPGDDQTERGAVVLMEHMGLQKDRRDEQGDNRHDHQRAVHSG
ncbi:hypothetical protein D3C76_1339830 [compost metagenome]